MRTRKKYRLLNFVRAMLFLCVAISVASFQSVAADTATVPVSFSGTCDYTQANMVVSLTNALRKEVGLDPLVMDQQLTAFAMQRAAECALVFSHDHIRPDGTAWYTLNPILMNGENIALGNELKTAVQVVNAWRDSEEHYENIKTASFQSIGVGCFRMGNCTYWAQTFSESLMSSAPVSGITTAKFTARIPLATARNTLMLASPVRTLEKGASNTVKPYFNSGETYTPAELGSEQFLFSSLSPEVASVDASGKVTALSAGTATICATLKAAPSVMLSVEYSVTDAKGRNLTLYAQGGKFPNGKSSRNYSVSNGSKYGNLPQPSRKGYTFEGWFEKNGKQIRPSTKVSIAKNTTKKLYAKWKKIKVAQASLSTVSCKKGRTLKASVRKVSGATGYQFYLSSNKKFKKKDRIVVQASAKKRSLSVAYTLSGKYAYVKVRAYKLDSAGRTVYGKFSAVRKVKLR